MPIVKVAGGYKVRSYVSGKLLARKYKTRKAAEAGAKRSSLRSKRKRSTGSKRARKGGY